MLNLTYKSTEISLESRIAYVTSRGSEGFTTLVNDIYNEITVQQKGYIEHDNVILYGDSITTDNFDLLDSVHGDLNRIYFIDEDNSIFNLHINQLKMFIVDLCAKLEKHKNVYIVFAARFLKGLGIQQDFIYLSENNHIFSINSAISKLRVKRTHLLQKLDDSTDIFFIEDRKSGFTYFDTLFKNFTIKTTDGKNSIATVLSEFNNKNTQIIIYDSIGISETMYTLYQYALANDNIFLLPIISTEGMILLSKFFTSNMSLEHKERLQTLITRLSPFDRNDMELCLKNSLENKSGSKMKPSTKEMDLQLLLQDIQNSEELKTIIKYNKKGRGMCCFIGECNSENSPCIDYKSMPKECKLRMNSVSKTYYDFYDDIVDILRFITNDFCALGTHSQESNTLKLF